MTPYLTFARDTVQTLIEKQSVRLAGKPDGPHVLTVSIRNSPSYRSVGRYATGELYTVDIEEQPLELNPVRLDMKIWPLLQRLEKATGDATYGKLLANSTRAVGEHGFDARSGLGYFGQEAEFDTVNLKPLSVSSFPEPKFKPSAEMPLEELWGIAPQKTARMIKAAYYGLVMQPETMDYNRFCYYDFSDADKKPSFKFDPGMIAFAQTGAMLVRYWGFLFARTGDTECLTWATKMTEKWREVQRADTGLVPHFFGAGAKGDTRMPAQQSCNFGDTMTAVQFLRAEIELRKRPESVELAKTVRDMGVKLLRGVLRASYNPSTRIFHEWLDLDGKPSFTAIWYAFPTQALKDEAVKRDPKMATVNVYAGKGFYSGAPWSHGVDYNMLPDVACGAELTHDRELIDFLTMAAPIVMEEAGKVKGPITPSGHWSYPASADYIKVMLALHSLTREVRYLDWAKQLAEMEIRHLAMPDATGGRPDWWRMPFRDGLPTAMTALHAAV